VILLGAAPVSARTTVTEYTRNADGALTAITAHFESDIERTTYLVWDDFIPDEGDPGSGQVLRGNGTLAGSGPTTAPQGWSESFAFDARDRLIQYTGDTIGEGYDYHAGGMISSSTTAQDQLRFYYETSEHGQACNLHAARRDTWSAYLDRARYLDDGTEQMMMIPRKDVAGIYRPAEDHLDSYAYSDAYGALTSAFVSATYDLNDNPFRYTGEYRDPVWGGYYLRARWYDPDLPGFISRDPEPHLSRYSYVAGNPSMRSDPSGLSYMSDFGRPLGGFLATLNKGVGGDFARVFLAPALGPLQILADPPGFWDAVKHNRAQIDVFLAASVAVEIVGGIMDSEVAGYAVSLGKRFAARTAADIVIGVGQSVVAGASRGRDFDWNALRQGLEYTAGSIFFRSYTGFNVRTGFQLEENDLAAVLRQLDDAPPRTAMVFRLRRPLYGSFSGASDTSTRVGRFLSSNPLREALNLGSYHEQLFAVTRDELFQSSATDVGITLTRTPNPGYAQIAQNIDIAFHGTARMEYVGKVENFRARRFLSNPQNRPIALRVGTTYGDPTGTPSKYTFYRNNCQYHALGVLKRLGLR